MNSNAKIKIRITKKVIIMTTTILLAVSMIILATIFISKLVANTQTTDPEKTTETSIAETTIAETDVTNSENEDWLYPEDVIEYLEKTLGYRPEYRISRWYEGHYALVLGLDHLEVWWGWEIDTDPQQYDGWRIQKSNFEKKLEEVRYTYLNTGIEAGNLKYSTNDVEVLFKNRYGYDVECYTRVYHYAGEETIYCDFILCDRYNGFKTSIWATLTNEGWRISEDNWLLFLENFKLEEEARYAISDIKWWSIEALEKEFKSLLGYVPKITAGEKGEYKNHDMFKMIIEFEHLGGKAYTLEYVFQKPEGYVITDKVFNGLLEENPEILAKN